MHASLSSVMSYSRHVGATLLMLLRSAKVWPIVCVQLIAFYDVQNSLSGVISSAWIQESLYEILQITNISE